MIEMQQKEEWLTVAEISSELKVPETTVREWIQTKKIQAHKLGRNWKIKRSVLEAFIENTSNK